MGYYYFYVDSNLLFEFSDKGNRQTCIIDTVEKPLNGSKDWHSIYNDYVNYYSFCYTEELVIRYWEKYSSDEFKVNLQNIMSTL